ncbi:MAG: S49 family peptidase, partial [Pyrinomonadaceae bacterium]|nr:S49 family peptidase [Pyrinomonadaceae bacterium]
NLQFDAMMARTGERLNGTRYVQVRENGVAVIEVSGVIAKKMNFFAEICGGGTSTEILMRDFQSALVSPNVSSIAFHIDSPGGEAFGINELAQAIFDARGKKPMKAYVSGLGCSGAYWIASACDEIIADKSSFLGSIGVVTTWTDDSGFYKSMGIRREVITSTNAPKKRLNLDKDEDRAELMRELDSLESVFLKAVARNRKMTVEQVKQDFNQGGVYSGADAVKAKMADRTGSLEQVIRELGRPKRNTASIGAENTEGEFEMGFKDDFRAFAAKLGFDVKEQIVPNAEAENAETETAAEAQSTILAEKEAAEKSAKAANDELARIKTEQEDARKRQISADADAFVESEIKAGRMFPSEKETFKSLFVQAAADDTASPLAEGSRLATLKANQTKRKPHTLTDEVIDAEANQIVLAAVGGDSNQVSAGRQKELLEKTPLGKSALKVVKGGGA